jgi:hypothetical protein
MSELQFHPAANIFPMMADDEFRSLRANIKRNGLLKAIVLYQGMILDGRNRYRACGEEGVEYRAVEYKDLSGITPQEWVWSMNAERRHLTSGQRAAAAAELLALEQADAAGRQRTHGGTAPGRAAEHSGNELPKCSDAGKATERAAKITRTNRTYVAVAAKAKRDDPEAFEALKNGTLKISELRHEQSADDTNTTSDRQAKSNTECKWRRGTYTEWQQLRELIGVVKEAATKIGTLTVDAQHKIPARMLCEDLAERFTKLAQRLVK